jgi:molybdopterin-guanine dinucleotide biosynthesis protein A
LSDEKEPVRLSPQVNDVGGMILAGGRSRRMGTDKALLLMNGQRLIDRVAEVMRGIFQEVIIIGNDPGAYADLNLPRVPDLRPGAGSLGGIYTGLSVSRFSRAFFVACDMPFLSTTLIRYLVHLDSSADVVIPRTRDGLQPLHAVYSRQCIPFIREMLNGSRFKIIDFFDQVRVREVREEEMRRHGWRCTSLLNINTREDLARALEIARLERMEP